MILIGEKQSTRIKILSQCYYVNHKFHMDWDGCVQEMGEWNNMAEGREKEGRDLKRKRVPCV
jgi:hypothetical protein